MGELIGFNESTGRAVYAAAGVGKLVGFNRHTGQAVRAAAGMGSYADLSTDFYKTFRPDNWQHAGSSGWSSANMPGWGNNPNLQMFARVGVSGGEVREGGGTALLIWGAVVVGLIVLAKSSKTNIFGR